MSGGGETPGYKGVKFMVEKGWPRLGGDVDGGSGGGTVGEEGGGGQG